MKKLTILLLIILNLLIIGCGKEKKSSMIVKMDMIIKELKNYKESGIKIKETGNKKNSNKKKWLLIKEITEDLQSGEKYISRKIEYDELGRKKNDEKINEKGKVKEFRKYKYSDSGKVIELVEKRFNGEKIRKYKYDKKGIKLGYLEKNIKGYIEGVAIYKYYPDGKLSYKYEYGGVGGFKAGVEKFYNEKEEVEKQTKESLDGVKTISTYIRSYDKKGGGVKSIVNDRVENKEGSVEREETIIFYNKEAQIISYKHIDFSGEIRYWLEREHDGYGNEIKTVWKDDEGKIKELHEMKYDEKGNEIESKEYSIWSASGKLELISRYLTYYDEDGKKIKIIRDDGEGKQMVIYYYKYKRKGE